MKGYLEQLEALRVAANLHSKLPIICSGDVFDKWNAPAELINFAMEYLPYPLYAVPGQHDLPDHDYKQLHRSAYGTLVSAEVIFDLAYKEAEEINSVDGLTIVLHGFRWGSAIQPLARIWDFTTPAPGVKHLHLAVVHKYVWNYVTDNPARADESNNLNALRKQFQGYDVVLIGDNHSGWRTHRSNTSFFNNGTFVRRKSDEVHYRPWVGLLRSDGTIDPHYLDTSKDKFVDVQDDTEMETVSVDADKFMAVLGRLADQPTEFRASVAAYLLSPEGRQLPEDVKAAIRSCV
jgi:predicted MPP superfamily phosphohydrolase